MKQLALLVVVVTVVACGKSGGDSKGGKKWFPAPNLGLEIELPTDDLTSVRENQAQPGRSADVTALQTSLAIYLKQGAPKWEGNVATDIADLKKRLEDTPFPDQKPTKYTKEETTANGWHVEWTLPKDELGLSYATMIDGRRIECLVLGASPKGHAVAVEACKSIRPLAAAPK